MGTVSSGVGLISGLDIQTLVSQLIDIDSGPLKLLQQRIADTKAQQTAYLSLTARLLAVKGAISPLSKASTFTSQTATSSDENVLSASASSATPKGSYAFTVRSLVSSHQLVSQGFRDRDSSPVGAGKITIEFAKGQVAPNTSLNVLNNGRGIRRGEIRIMDRAGGTADVNLTGVTTIDDVLNAINSQNTAEVRAYATGGAIVIEDRSGGTASSLRIVDIGGGYAAADLGIAKTSADGKIQGNNLIALTESTPLSRLNDGIGVRFDRAQADFQINLADGHSFQVNLTDVLTFDTHLAELNDGHGVRLGTIRITNHKGDSAEVDLSAAQTIQDVKDRINDSGLGVTVTSLTDGKLVIHDASDSTASHLKIEDVDNYAAADLGIVADTAEDTITGSKVYRMETVGTVIKAIESAAQDNGANLSVAISGSGIVLTDQTTGSLETEVLALNGSMAARDLGLLSNPASQGQIRSRDLMAGLNTVLLSSLKGGSGLTPSAMSFTRRDGSTVDGLDFSGAQNLSDVMAIINADGRLSAQVDEGGTRIRITDPTSGSGTLSASGAMADALGLTSAGSGELVSADLQLQYVGENTRLSELNSGRGIAYGRFRITAADGATRLVTLTTNLHPTVGDVIETINTLDIGVVARINANGDGIALEDTTGGSGTLEVTADGTATTAADLGILGKANASGVLEGTLAKQIEVAAAETLDDLVDKINLAKIGLKASVINDGTSDNPYRLVLTSDTAGTPGQVSFSSDIPGLSLLTMSEAKDAVVVVGQPGSPNAVLVSSHSNTVTNLVPGLKLNLLGTSETPVQVTVAQDVENIVTDVKTFINTFNDAMDTIATLTRFIPETNEKGKLMGDRVVQQIQSRLFDVLDGGVNVGGLDPARLRSVGIMVDSSGGQGARLTLTRTVGKDNALVTMDGEAQLREALANDPEAVTKLFSLMETDKNGKAVNVGIAAKLNEELNAITTSAGGLISDQNANLQSKIDQFQERSTELQKLLDLKQARLYAQFQAMETTLAKLQGQQSSLASLANLAASWSSSTTKA